MFLVASAWLAGAALPALGMTVVFMAAAGINLAQGEADFHCGCFSTLQEGEGSGWDLMWRDALLLMGRVWLALLTRRPPSGGRAGIR